MLGLYIHVPFCLKKCSYCSFFSVPRTEQVLRIKFLEGLEYEIQLRFKEVLAGVSSLFIGGGTPTVLETEELERILKAIHARFEFAPPDLAVEKTVEANPGTLTSEKLAVLKKYGINRISLGAQSFTDSVLKTIGRSHRASDITRSVKLIRDHKIDNLNLDLIFGLPGQNILDWEKTLRQAVALEPEHLSLYALSVDEGTPLWHQVNADRNNLLQIPDDDLQADMYDLAVEYLKSRGYSHYEISNFALPGYECRHNLSYWEAKDYIGVGPGAVSSQQKTRTKNIENIYGYWARLKKGVMPIESSETLSEDQILFEYIMLGLRTAKGIDKELFARKFGCDIRDIYGEVLSDYKKKKFLLEEDGRIRIHPSYYFVANSIISGFLR
ncbi:MAG: radical SAM family heme chaperone HemW [Desulfitobacteriia bacterium]|jgi:oxygen-independent coproporphyrinogen-3 oxidase